jgi:hypothetical protein
LIENILLNFPAIKYIKVLKHPEEWYNYSEKIRNLFGFHKTPHPLIFLSNGRLIGSKDEFFNEIKKNFKTNLINDQGKLEIDPMIIKSLTLENIKLTNDEYLIRKNGSKLRDKIEKKMISLSFSDLLSEMNSRFNTLDRFYEREYIAEMNVYYKYDLKFASIESEYKEYPELLDEGVVEIEIERTTPLNTTEGNKEIDQKEEQADEENLQNSMVNLIPKSKNYFNFRKGNKIQIL